MLKLSLLWVAFLCFAVCYTANAQQFVPIQVTGFNADLVANGAGNVQATTTSGFDSNGAFGTDFYEAGYSTGTRGLPSNGVITSTGMAGVNYKLAGYSGNNALFLQALNESGTLTFNTPASFQAISILAASAGSPNGTTAFTATVNFSDGTNTTYNFSVPDWFATNGASIAIQGVDRVSYLSDAFDNTTTDPKLFDCAFSLNSTDQSKLITSITCTKTVANDHTGIFAVCGIKPATVTWSNPADIVYGTALSATQLNATASVAGTFSYTPNTGKVLNAGAAQTLSVTFTPTNTFLSPITKTVVINVTKAPLTVTADDKTVAYGDAIPSYTVTYNGLVNGDTPSAISGTPTYTCSYSTTSPVSSSPLTITPDISPLSSSNYTFTGANGKVTINKAPLTITADNKTIVYGDVVPTLTVTYNGFVNGEGAGVFTTPLDVTTAPQYSPVTTYPIVPANATADNYNITFTNGTLTVNQAPLTVTADNQTKEYGDPNPAFTFVYSGFVGTEDETNLTTKPTASSLATQYANAGTYDITPSGGVATNYAFIYVKGVFTINKAPLTVYADNKMKTYGDMNPTFTYTYAGFKGSDNESSLTTPPSVTTLATQFSNAGLYVITQDMNSIYVNQLGSYVLYPGGAVSPNYDFTYVPGNIYVNKATPVITWNNPSDIVAGTQLSSTQLNATANVPGVFTYSPSLGTVLPIGNAQSLTVQFTPDNQNYLSVSKSVQTNVAPPAPSLTNSPGNTNYISSTPGVAIDPNVTATGSVLINNAIVYISSGFVSSEDLLVYPANLYGVTGSYNSTTGVLTFSGTTTVDKYQQILKTVQYQNSNPNSSGSRIVSYALGDAIPFSPCGGATPHYYKFVSGTIDWTTANSAANASSYFGLKGYLATISCSQENDFAFGSIKQSGWIGGVDVGGGNWTWAGGPEAGQTFFTGFSGGVTTSPLYNNWNGGEPNNPGSEQYVQFLSGSGLWNNLPNIGLNGYYVEYGGSASDPVINISDSKSITILPNTVVNWNNPTDISYGTVLSNAQLNATANVPGVFTYSPALGAVLPAGTNETLTVQFIPSDTRYAVVNKTVTINVTGNTPVVNWDTPADIVFGTSLTGVQLNAKSDIAGTYVYAPVATTVLNAGANQILSVTFTPSDPNYVPVIKTVQINVLKATPTITWDNPSDIVYGTALSGTQLNATPSVPGTFAYMPAAGTVLNAGFSQDLMAMFMPTDAANYNSVSKTVKINVLKANPVLTWANPSDLTYGATLGDEQLNAISNVPGVFAYAPASGALLHQGSNQLEVVFTPADVTNYNVVGKAVKINVGTRNPVVVWVNPETIVYGTHLSSAQLNATAVVEGTWSYSPDFGTVLNAGLGQTLSVTFTPTDSRNYAPVTQTVKINVLKADPIITWSNPAFITNATPLGINQLNATANVPGTFVYTPAAGTLMNYGLKQPLQTVFTPTEITNYNTAQKTVWIDVVKAAPTTQAQITSFTHVFGTNLEINWARGNGDYCMVFMQKGSTGTPAPADGKSYVADSTYKGGSRLGDWFCVYQGTGTFVKVRGLDMVTQYRVMVVEYNEFNDYQSYNLTTNSSDPLNVTTMGKVTENVIASNLVTPNGDGKNDLWVVQRIEELADYDLYIMNNLGEVVFQTKGYQNNWDGSNNGTELPSGTYYYIFSKGEIAAKGYITLVR